MHRSLLTVATSQLTRSDDTAGWQSERIPSLFKVWRRRYEVNRTEGKEKKRGLRKEVQSGKRIQKKINLNSLS